MEDRLKSNKMNFHYLGWQLQNETIKWVVKCKKKCKILKSKYFSVQLDCFRDKRHEQLKIIIHVTELYQIRRQNIKLISLVYIPC